MRITEKDIYKFVNYPAELEAEKIEYIEANFDLFEENVNFLREVETNKTEKLSENLTNKFEAKISHLHDEKTFVLKRVVENLTPKYERLNLAADSYELKKHNITDTFTDEKNKFILKVVNSDDKSKIYLFNSDNSEIKNFEIVLKKPVEQVYHCSTNKEPLVIDLIEGIDAVEVRLQ